MLSGSGWLIFGCCGSSLGVSLFWVSGVAGLHALGGDIASAPVLLTNVATVPVFAIGAAGVGPHGSHGCGQATGVFVIGSWSG